MTARQAASAAVRPGTRNGSLPRLTCSSTPVDKEDWTVDTNAATCSVTDVRCLDWYQLEPTKSVFIGVVDINNSASKECGEITLDLLLQARVLVEQDDDRWELVEDMHQRGSTYWVT